MLTQKDIHNHLVNNTEPWQKSYISMQCGNDVEKMKKMEKGIADLVNGVVGAIKTNGFDYLNKEL